MSIGIERHSSIIATTTDPSINGALLSTRDGAQIMSQIDRHAAVFGGVLNTKVFVRQRRQEGGYRLIAVPTSSDNLD